MKSTLPRINSRRVSTRVGTGIDLPTTASIPCHANVIASLAPPGIPASSSWCQITQPKCMQRNNAWTHHHDFAFWIRFLDMRSNVGIVSAASAHEYLIDVLRRGKPTVMVNDSLGRDPRYGRNDVVTREAFRFSFRDEIMSQSVSEDFAASSNRFKISIVCGKR